MKEISAIELLFENCETLRLGINVLGDVYLGKINPEIARIACNSIAERVFVDEVALEIFSEAEELGVWTPEWGNHNSKLGRIAFHNDITQIEILYSDGSSKTYFIDYEEESEALGAPNINQKSYISSLGNLYIVISKEKDIEDYFSCVHTEDEETVKFNKNMYGIGVQE